MKNAVIALGSNLDDPVAQIRRAYTRLQQLPQSCVMAASSLYRTAPVGYAGQPDFINAVLLLETGLDKHELLRQLQQVEYDFGRVRSFANAPRTLDLDIIDYHGEVYHDAQLTLPHPRAHGRAFVMQPLVEIAPDYMIGTQRAAEIAGQLGGNGIVCLTAETPLHHTDREHL